MVEVEVKDTQQAKLIASGLVMKTAPKSFTVEPPGGLEVFGEDHGWIFRVDEDQAALIRYWLGES